MIFIRFRRAVLLKRRIASGSPELVVDAPHQRPIALGLRSIANPAGVGLESIPRAFAVGHVVITQDVMQLIAGARHHVPETDDTNTVSAEIPERRGLEATMQRRQLARHCLVATIFKQGHRRLLCTRRDGRSATTEATSEMGS